MDTSIPKLLGGLAGGLCLVIGLWIVLAGSDDTAAGPTVEAQTVGADAAQPPITPTATAPGAAPAGGDPAGTVTVTYPEGQAPPTTPPTFPLDAAVTGLACDTSGEGFGVTWRLWGNETSGVWLPYANGWPTNEPGKPPLCAPETDFGAAIVAVHALYIDSLAPGWIPVIAVDTPARQARMERHGGPEDPTGIGQVCEPVGWSVPDGLVWIFHRCGDRPLVVTKVIMDWFDERWQLRYTITGHPGTHETAEAGWEYYPFGDGGD